MSDHSGCLPQTSSRLPALYSWTARDSCGGCSVGGVTSQPDRATELLSTAIRNMSLGATGSIRLVRIDPQAYPSAYVLGPLVLRMRRDPATGVRVLEVGDAQ